MTTFDGDNVKADDIEGKRVRSESVQTEGSVIVDPGEATDTLHYGNTQDRANAGDRGVALGVGARVPEDSSVAVGYRAGRNNTGIRSTMIGKEAGQNNTDGLSTMTGYQAGQNNTGGSSTMTGYKTGQNNTGGSSTMTGYNTGRYNTGNDSTMTGYQAGQNNTGNNSTLIGANAGRGDGLADVTTMGDDNIGIGKSALRDNQASGLIGIGQEAGNNATTDDQLIITDRNGVRRMVMDLTNGDLKIDGSLTQNATL